MSAPVPSEAMPNSAAQPVQQPGAQPVVPQPEASAAQPGQSPARPSARQMTLQPTPQPMPQPVGQPLSRPPASPGAPQSAPQPALRQPVPQKPAATAAPLNPSAWGQAAPPYPAQPVMAAAVLPPRPIPLPKPKRQWQMGGVDGLFALASLLLGFLFWSWLAWPRGFSYQGGTSSDGYSVDGLALPGVSVSLFVWVALALSLTYYRLKKVRLTAGAWTGAGVLALMALPFTFFAATPVLVLLGLLLLVGLVTWNAWVSGSRVSRWLGAEVVADALNQGVIGPVMNIGAWGQGLKTVFRGNKQVKSAFIALLGVVIGLPVLAGVVILFSSADPTFQRAVNNFTTALTRLNLGQILGQLILGVPVAIYVFGILYGNARRENVTVIKEQSLRTVGRATRQLSSLLLAAPMAVLVAIHVLFFAVMGTYLFSAFSGRLAAGYTYAGYARRGFFELAAVASIDLVVIAFAYFFARWREVGAKAGEPVGGAAAAAGKKAGVGVAADKAKTAGKSEKVGKSEKSAATVGESSTAADKAKKFVYPTSLRVIGFSLCLMTLLVVITSVAKMVMYISAYNVTRLRIYVLAAEIALLLVFAVLAVWHLKPFRASRFIVTACLVVFAVLSWTNVDGFIADYDVNQYLSGQTSQIDVAYLGENLSDAAVPALTRLAQADRGPVSRQAQRELDNSIYSSAHAPANLPWTAWNLQSHQAQTLLGE